VDQMESPYAEIIARDENVKFSLPNFKRIYINVDRIYMNVNRTLQSRRDRNLWGWTTSAPEAVEGRNVAHILRFKNITLCIIINSRADKQFTVTTSGPGAIRRRTTLSHINDDNPNRSCSHSNQQVHTWPNVEYDKAHGSPDDK
jgi:hypothetical protein